MPFATALDSTLREVRDRLPESNADPMPVAITDTADNLVKAGDAANNAIRVNVVAGGAGGGVAQTQVRNAGDSAWVNVGIGAESGTALHMPVRIQDTGANPAAVANADPTAASYGLVVRNMPSVPDLKYAQVNATADGDNPIIAAVGGKKIRVLGYAVMTTGAATILLQDTSAGPVVHARIRSGVDGGGAAYAGGVHAPAFETAVGEGVEINNPAGIDSFGHITYLEV